MASAGSSGGGGSSCNLRGGEYFVVEIIVALLVCILTPLFAPKIGGKTPLLGSYETTQYLISEDFEFEDSQNIIDGLKYLHEKTNVQMVILAHNSEGLSEETTLKRYYELFNDEAHVLLIITPDLFYSMYYAIGDSANEVIDDESIDYFISKIEYSRTNGKVIEKELRNFADKLVK